MSVTLTCLARQQARKYERLHLVGGRHDTVDAGAAVTRGRHVHAQGVVRGRVVEVREVEERAHLERLVFPNGAWIAARSEWSLTITLSTPRASPKRLLGLAATNRPDLFCNHLRR